MKVTIIFLCFLAGVYCQILRPGNTPEEGVPIYEEIKVESVLTVRSKSGSRAGKSSSDLAKNSQNGSDTTEGVNVSRRARSTEFRKEFVDQMPGLSHAKRRISLRAILDSQQPSEA